MPLPVLLAMIVVPSIPVVVLVVVTWLGRRQAQRLNAAWGPFAAQRGWRFEPASGAFFWRSPVLQVERAGATISIEAYPSGRGPRRTYTQGIYGNPSRGMHEPVAIATTPSPMRRSPTWLLVALRGDESWPCVPTGDATFDRVFSVGSSDPEAVLELLTASCRAALVELARLCPSNVFLCVQRYRSGPRLELQFGRFEVADRAFEHAVAALAATHRSA